MSGQFSGIRPEDMTKLYLIAGMMLRDVRKYAQQIVDSIDEPTAREVADFLVEPGIRCSAGVKSFCERIRCRVASI